MADFKITNVSLADCDELTQLYRDVAEIEGGLARTKSEIADDYAEHFVSKALTRGLILAARHSENGKIIGEIHASTPEPKVFAHVLGDLTIAVHPDFQGIGTGKALFTEFLNQVIQHRPEILRVELIARESNRKALAFYEKLGFRIEGRFEQRIRSVGGGYEADIPMAWLRNR